MILFVGLGNPGGRHAANRHNVGFMALDAILRDHRFLPLRRRFQGEASEGTLAGCKVLALKPQTFMNESGRSVGEAARFYRVSPDNIVVFHDELDLPSGKIRVKTGGGVAGHNGLRSIAAHIGPDFRRVRIGIGHPGDKNKVHGHVLRDFAKTDRDWLEPVMDAISLHAALLARGEDSSFMNRVHLTINPEPPDNGDGGNETPTRES